MERTATYDSNASQLLALLSAALDSVDTTHDLIGRIRQTETFTSERRELRSVVDLIGDTRKLIHGLLASERGR